MTKPRDLKGPDDLRPVKMPRRIVLELDSLKPSEFYPRWGVVEMLLKIRAEHQDCANDPDTTSREEREG